MGDENDVSEALDQVEQVLEAAEVMPLLIGAQEVIIGGLDVETDPESNAEMVEELMHRNANLIYFIALGSVLVSASRVAARIGLA